MSITNNIDEGSLLRYIASSFHNWGITYITDKVLKQAKNNDSSCTQSMSRLMFDLVLLHLFDFQLSIEELGVQFQERGHMEEVVLGHLYQIDCSLLVVLENGKEGDCVVGFDFGSSRHMLITCGWIMAVSDFFGQTHKLIRKKMDKIYRAKPVDLASLSQKYSATMKQVNLHEQSPSADRIAFLCKTLKGRTYSLECLKAKKDKLMSKIRQNLKVVESPLNVEDLLSGTDHEDVLRQENEMRDSLFFEKQNIKYRKCWWVWLDSKIISSKEKILKEEIEQYERLECKIEDQRFRVQIDLDYPRKYVETCRDCMTQVETILLKIEKSGLAEKKTAKQIDKNIMQEIKRMSEKGRCQQVVFPSFAGMQLKKEMNFEQFHEEADHKDHQKAVKRSNKELKKSISRFLEQLEGILLI